MCELCVNWPVVYRKINWIATKFTRDRVMFVSRPSFLTTCRFYLSNYLRSLSLLTIIEWQSYVLKYLLTEDQVFWNRCLWTNRHAKFRGVSTSHPVWTCCFLRPISLRHSLTFHRHLWKVPASLSFLAPYIGWMWKITESSAVHKGSKCQVRFLAMFVRVWLWIWPWVEAHSFTARDRRACELCLDRETRSVMLRHLLAAGIEKVCVT